MVRFLAYKCRHRGRQEFSTSMGAACCREYPPLQIRSYHQLLCVHRLFYALKACRLSRCPPNPVPKSKDRRLLHLFSAFLIRSIIRTRLFNDYLGSLTNTPVIQRLLGCLTITAEQNASIRAKSTKPRRRIACSGVHLCAETVEKPYFKRFSGVEKVHRNSIKITVDLWWRRGESNPCPKAL